MNNPPKQVGVKMRRKMLQVAAEVAAIAARASTPEEAKKELYKTVQTLRKRYGFTNEVKRTEILRLIQLGASAVNDLVMETGFDRDDIYAITKELEAEELIVLKKMPSIGERGGRPTLLFLVREPRS